MISRAAVLTMLMATVGGWAQESERPFGKPENLGSILRHAETALDVEDRLAEQGLVVLSDVSSTDLYRCYYELELSGQPGYITSDVMLYLWYETHREAVTSTEKQVLAPAMLELVAGLQDAVARLRARGDSPELRANAAMLGVTRKLLDAEWTPEADIADEVGSEVAKVLAHSEAEPYPGEDYTQYTPRGFYADHPVLTPYFRGAKYLARRYFAVEADNEAGLRQACLLALALRDGDGLRERYDRIAALRTALTGPVDTIGLGRLLDACTAVYGEGWGAEALSDMAPLLRELTTGDYPDTRISNRLVVPEKAEMAARNVAVLGEHYIPDSDLFTQTTEPNVPHRSLPMGLEVAAALGDPIANRLLAEAASDFPQVPEIARSFGEEMALEGVYGDWMETLSTLSERPEGAPDFAAGAAYDLKQLNCCLTSWAHLRHNYLLYGAQPYSYLGETMGAPPGIVEPNPGFFAQYADTCATLGKVLTDAGVEGRAPGALVELETKARTFARCAEDIVSGRDWSWANCQIKQFAEWMKRLPYDSPLTVADVCTSSETGQVLHVASGPFHPVVAVMQTEDRCYAVLGYVGSYHEFAEPQLTRLTDEEWSDRCDLGAIGPETPTWLANLYATGAADNDTALRELATALRGLDAYAACAAYDAWAAPRRQTEVEVEGLVVLLKALGHLGATDRMKRYATEIPFMYGCDAQAKATKVAAQAASAAWRTESSRAEEDRFVRLLATTDPRPGLTPEEERARQDERAAILIAEAGALRELMSHEPQRDPVPLMERIVRECPESGYLPFAELALVLYPALPTARGDMLVPAECDMEDVARRLEALGQRYADSGVGRAARVAFWCIAGPEHALADVYDALQTEATAVGDAEESHPLSVAALRGAVWARGYGFSGGIPSVFPEEVLEYILREGLLDAYARGDYGLLARLVAAGSGDLPGSVQQAGGLVQYLEDEPEALALIAVPHATFLDSDGSVDPAGLWRAAREVVDRFPNSKAAPAALRLVWLEMRDERRFGPDQAESGRAARGLLLDEYPDSLEAAHVRLAEARAAGQEDEERAVIAGLESWWDTHRPEGWAGAPPRYVRSLTQGLNAGGEVDPEIARWEEEDRARQAERRSEELQAARDLLGPWFDAAGLTDADVPEYAEPYRILTVAEQRLGDRAFEMVLDLSENDSARAWCEGVAHKYLDHPEARELALSDLRHASFDSMATRSGLPLVALGPEYERYEEAVTLCLNATATSNPDHPVSASISRDEPGYRARAREYAGTPAEPVALAMLGRLYRRFGRPEEGILALREDLKRIDEGRPGREALVRVLGELRESADAKIRKREAGLAAVAQQTPPDEPVTDAGWMEGPVQRLPEAEPTALPPDNAYLLYRQYVEGKHIDLMDVPGSRPGGFGRDRLDREDRRLQDLCLLRLEPLVNARRRPCAPEWLTAPTDWRLRAGASHLPSNLGGLLDLGAAAAQGAHDSSRYAAFVETSAALSAGMVTDWDPEVASECGGAGWTAARRDGLAMASGALSAQQIEAHLAEIRRIREGMFPVRRLVECHARAATAPVSGPFGPERALPDEALWTEDRLARLAALADQALLSDPVMGFLSETRDDIEERGNSGAPAILARVLNAIRWWHRVRTQLAAIETACLLELHRSRTGDYPESLDELAEPASVSSLTGDAFDYERTPKGYRLATHALDWHWSQYGGAERRDLPSADGVVEWQIIPLRRWEDEEVTPAEPPGSAGPTL